MKKKMIALLVACLLFVGGCGRNNISTETKDLSVSDEYVCKIPQMPGQLLEVLADNADFTSSTLGFSGSIYIVVSDYEIPSNTKVTACFDGGEVYECELGEVNESQITEETLLMYQAEEWAEYQGNHEEQMFSEYADPVIEKMPKLYWCYLMVPEISYPDETSSYKTVTFTIGDFEKKYNLKNCSSNFPEDDFLMEGDLLCNTVAIAQKNIDGFDEDGSAIYSTGELTFSVDNNLKLTNVYVWNQPHDQVEKISVVQDGMDFLWDLEDPLELEKDQEIQLTVEVKDPDMKKYEAFNRFFVYEYEQDGKKYSTIVNIGFTARDKDVYQILYREGLLK